MNLPDDLRRRLSATHLPALDGLRAVAVFLVIFYHFGFDLVPGGRGVTMFFVLSGFLITWLLLKENERDGHISLQGFYRRRVLRIFPAFYVYWVGLVALLLITNRKVLWPHAWSAFFYVSDYYNALKGDPNNGFSHTWSLGIEEQFYLLWPFAFLFLRRNLTRMAGFLAAGIISIWIYRALLCYGLGVRQGYIYAAFDTRADALLVGCLVAVALRGELFAKFWAIVVRNAALPLLTVAFLACLIWVGNSYIPRYRDVLGFALEPPLIAILMVQLIVHSQGRLWGWTEWRIMKFLGRISYSLYLYQQVVLGAARHVTERLPLIVQLVVALVATTAVAAASYYVIELPFLKLKDRLPFGRELRTEGYALHSGVAAPPT